jgi:hypothetical protein
MELYNFEKKFSWIFTISIYLYISYHLAQFSQKYQERLHGLEEGYLGYKRVKIY